MNTSELAPRMNGEVTDPERAKRAARTGIQRRAAMNSEQALRIQNEVTDPERVQRATPPAVSLGGN
jgi:hypothetical protein